MPGKGDDAYLFRLAYGPGSAEVSLADWKLLVGHAPPLAEAVMRTLEDERLHSANALLEHRLTEAESAVFRQVLAALPEAEITGGLSQLSELVGYIRSG